MRITVALASLPAIPLVVSGKHAEATGVARYFIGVSQ